MSDLPLIPEMPSKKSKPYVIRLDDRTEIMQFISGLKKAFAKAKTTGGMYSVFVHPKSGPVLQMEIQVGVKL